MRRHPFAALGLVIALMAAGITPASAAAAPGTDLAVTLVAPSGSTDRGATFSITVTVTNQGSEAASEVSLVSYLSDGLDLGSTVTSDPSMTCVLGEYRDLTCSQPSLGPGDASSVTLSLTRVMSRETYFDAWAAGAEEDSNYENNYANLYLEPDRSNPADVEVRATAPKQPEPGERFDYTSYVTNRGPEIARDVTFSQSLSDLVTFVSVTSSDPTDECRLHEEVYDAEGIEGGPYTYREVRCSLGSMRFAEQAVITVTAVRDDPHELWSSTWVGTSSFDDNYENDWSDASTAGHPSVTSDLALTMTRSPGQLLVGDDATYNLTVTNTGPAPAGDAVAELWVPQELAIDSITPTRPGDSCQQNDYQGITCDFGNLAVGDTAGVAVAVTRVRAREFWMGGSIYSTNYDPNYENNYAESQTAPDTSNPADVSVDIDGPEDPAVGSDFDYTITVTNTGPEEAASVNVAASLPEGTEFVSAGTPDDSDVCTLHEETYAGEGMKLSDSSYADYTYRELRCDLGSMVPAESTTVTLRVTRTTDYEMWASAWVSTASFDENYENDYDSTDSNGKVIPPCGVASDSDTGGGVVVCDRAAGEAGGSDSYGVTGTAGKRALRTGAGNDTVTINIPARSKKHRELIVNGGRGRDVINVVVAPGAGNITVILKGGKGRDRIEVSAPRPGKGFELRMRGGLGADKCSSEVGDRHRERAC